MSDFKSRVSRWLCTGCTDIVEPCYKRCAGCQALFCKECATSKAVVVFCFVVDCKKSICARGDHIICKTCINAAKELVEVPKPPPYAS